jgi:hypothetical protein
VGLLYVGRRGQRDSLGFASGCVSALGLKNEHNTDRFVSFSFYREAGVRGGKSTLTCLHGRV